MTHIWVTRPWLGKGPYNHNKQMCWIAITIRFGALFHYLTYAIEMKRKSTKKYLHWNRKLLVSWEFKHIEAETRWQPFPDDIFKSIFFNENVQVLINISLTFVPKAPINNILALVQIMAWRRPGNKSLSDPMMVSLLTHICVTRPQWVNKLMMTAR